MAKVLIVDDSVMMRVLVKEMIGSDPDLEVAGDAANGQEAVERAKALKPDVILLDIEMPVMDGIECMKRLKLVSKAKVIVLSSVAQLGSAAAAEARQLGALEVIPKPSGAVSLDLKQKKGHDIVKAVRRAVGLAGEG